MNIIKKFFLMNLFLGGISIEAIREKTVSITLIEDRVGEVKFTQRRDVVNGKVHQEWLIDGKRVDVDTFEEEYLNQEKEALRAKRAHERQQRDRESIFQAKVQQEIMAQLAHHLIEDILERINSLSNDVLKDYIQYSPEITHWNDIVQIQDSCTNLRTMLNNPEVEIQELKNFLDTYQHYPTLLTDIYQATVTYAIKHCNDTKVLKELLTTL